MKEVCYILRHARIKSNLTQAAVAKGAGVSSQYLNDVEHARRGLTLASVPVLRRLAECVDVADEVENALVAAVFWAWEGREWDPADLDAPGPPGHRPPVDQEYVGTMCRFCAAYLDASDRCHGIDDPVERASVLVGELKRAGWTDHGMGWVCPDCSRYWVPRMHRTVLLGLSDTEWRTPRQIAEAAGYPGERWGMIVAGLMFMKQEFVERRRRSESDHSTATNTVVKWRRTPLGTEALAKMCQWGYLQEGDDGHDHL